MSAIEDTRTTGFLSIQRRRGWQIEDIHDDTGYDKSAPSRLHRINRICGYSRRL